MGVARSVVACVVFVAAGVAIGQPTASRSNISSEVSPTIVEFGGYYAFTKPSRDATMGFTLPTQVMDIKVKGGQEVKKGDLLIKGDDREDDALARTQKVRADTDLPEKRAKAEMDLAEIEYNRMVEASSKGGSSPQEVDRARLVRDARAMDYQLAIHNQTQEKIQVERYDARVAHMRLIAPFDGEVDDVKVDVGQAVSENEKIIRVVNVDPLWIDVPAMMTDVATLALKNGERAWVMVEVAGKYRLSEGKVVEVSPVADPSSRTRRVRVELANPKGEKRLVAGEPAWVRFTAPPADFAQKLGAVAVGDGKQ